MLRLFLPPNLPAAAARDAVAVRVELGADAPATSELPALARLQTWCGGATQLPAGGVAKPPPFVQLSRAQLRELVQLLVGRPAFFRLDAPQQPLLWVGPILRGVTEHLGDPEPLKPAAPPLSAPTPSRLANARPNADDNGLTPMTVDGSEHYLVITLPSRESFSHTAALDLVKSHGFVLEPANRKWWLRDRHKTLNFLATHGETLRSTFHAEFTDNFQQRTAHLAEAVVRCEVREVGGGFAVTFGLDTGEANDAHLRDALASSRAYVQTGGKIYLLPPRTLTRLAEGQRALAGDPAAVAAPRRTHQITGARVAEVQELMEEIAPHFQPPDVWRERGAALRDLSALVPAPVPAGLAARLRPYQRLGVAWLWHLCRHGLGGILADEMGLGKTPQALALLSCVAGFPNPVGPDENSRRKAAGLGDPALQRSPSLVVCPASLVENWRREAANFAPQLRVFVHHGDRRLADAKSAGAFDVVITSYGTLARDRELLAEIELACLVADEAQHAKNRRTQNARALRALTARARFLLTGTPVENSLEDLRALFEVLMPGYLDPLPAGTRGDERAWFDGRLRAKTAPYILRRTKQAVAPELPEKIEQVIWCELSSTQAALYRETQQKSERALLDLAAGGASENALRLAALTQLLRLRQICCDPRLLPGAKNSALISDPARPAVSSYLDSAKLDAFRELLAEAVDDGHRLLVFSQFTALLALLREELAAQELPCCYLDGSMTVRARQAEVDRFQTSTDVPVFFISLKAGGTGLNLTAADTVVHFDPWWNPAVEAQATDRAHRIGQSRVVTSYKLICAGTVEEKVLQLQDSKRALLADIFEASDAAAAKLGLADLQDLLRT
jgi:superfamily II DNA or RNA helicase